MQKLLLSFILLMTVFFVFNSCSKLTDALKNPDQGICDSIALMRIKGAKTTYYVGESISLSCKKVDNVFYTWSHSNVRTGSLSDYPSLTISSCTKDYTG